MGQALSDCQCEQPQSLDLADPTTLLCLKKQQSIESAESHQQNLEELIFQDAENMLGINEVSINELQEAIRPISSRGIAAKEDVLQALFTIRQLNGNSKLEKFLSAYEKKKQQSPSKSTQEVKYIPLHKLLVGLYFLSKDSMVAKLNAIYILYQQSQMEQSKTLSIQRLKDLIDHLYFLVIYGITALVDPDNIHFNQIQALKLEMQKRAQSDKLNLLRLFNQFGGLFINEDDFTHVFLMVKSICTTSGIRTRIMPCLGSVVSVVYYKAEMIKRCYGSKTNHSENSPKRKKQVRFHQGPDETNQSKVSISSEDRQEWKQRMKLRSPTQLRTTFQEDQKRVTQKLDTDLSPLHKKDTIDEIDSDSLKLPTINIQRSDDLAEQSTLSEEKISPYASKSIQIKPKKKHLSDFDSKLMDRIHLFENSHSRSIY